MVLFQKCVQRFSPSTKKAPKNEFEFWCLTPFSAISWQPVLVVEEAEYPERTTDIMQTTGKLYHLRVEYTLFVIYKARHFSFKNVSSGSALRPRRPPQPNY
jgi:hypothetical protein